MKACHKEGEFGAWVLVGLFPRHLSRSTTVWSTNVVAGGMVPARSSRRVFVVYVAVSEVVGVMRSAVRTTSLAALAPSSR